MNDPDVDVDVARRLVDEQFAHVDPHAARESLRVVDVGWDNLIVRLGEHLALRLPVRELAAGLVPHEARWLPEVAATLPVRAPVPVFVGAPTAYYPWPWLVVPWIEGTVVADVPVEDRWRLVDDLADTMLALHRPAPDDAPPNPFRGMPLQERDAGVRARISDWPGAADVLLPAWAAAVAAPVWPGPPLWLHGDPHPRNLVADDAGLAGILDFGDITSGDPANDLATAWWCFGPDDRERFIARLDAAGRYDRHVWARAAGWAVVVASAVGLDTPMGSVAVHTVEQLALEVRRGT